MMTNASYEDRDADEREHQRRDDVASHVHYFHSGEVSEGVHTPDGTSPGCRAPILGTVRHGRGPTLDSTPIFRDARQHDHQQSVRRDTA